MKNVSAGLLVLIFSCALTASAKTTTVTYYQACTPADPAYKATMIAVKRFEAINRDIRIKVVPESGLDKVLAATAAGLAPDCMMVDGPVITSMAIKKILRPLDDFIKRDHITASDYWAPSWNEALWQGRIYAMTWATDANFGLYWNKKHFAEAGLAGPPKTISELEIAQKKLSKRKPNGVFTRVGLLPWGIWGYSNSIYTWGWCFGGEFYNSSARKVTPDDPKVVKALDWLYEQVTVNGGLAKFASVSKDPNSIFAQGVASMVANNSQGIPFLSKYHDIDYDIATMPSANGVTDNPTWVGGWKVAILPYSKHPEAAWKWVKFITADPKGTVAACESLGWFPGYKKSELYKKLDQNLNTARFLRIVEKAAHQRPVMPVNQEYADALNTAVDTVMSGKNSASQALAKCRLVVQKQLDYYISKYVK